MQIRYRFWCNFRYQSEASSEPDAETFYMQICNIFRRKSKVFQRRFCSNQRKFAADFWGNSKAHLEEILGAFSDKNLKHLKAEFAVFLKSNSEVISNQILTLPWAKFCTDFEANSEPILEQILGKILNPLQSRILVQFLRKFLSRILSHFWTKF